MLEPQKHMSLYISILNILTNQKNVVFRNHFCGFPQ